MNTERLIQCFTSSLGIPQEHVSENLAYQTIPEWDSVHHMALIAAIETEFNLMLNTDDIVAIRSFSKAKSILAKHGVSFNSGAQAFL